MTNNHLLLSCVSELRETIGLNNIKYVRRYGKLGFEMDLQSRVYSNKEIECMNIEACDNRYVYIEYMMHYYTLIDTQVDMAICTKLLSVPYEKLQVDKKEKAMADLSTMKESLRKHVLTHN